MPLSGNQIDSLGKRLKASDQVATDDLDLLEELLSEHAAALLAVEDRLRSLGLSPHGRLKTSRTIVEKLQRGPLSLRGVHDLAGTRVVHKMTLDQHTELSEAILRVCPGAKLLDRRVQPSHGYRAVHVNTKVDGRWVEIQLRTLYQDTWAQTTEWFADRWGRQMRYGHAPNDPDAPFGAQTSPPYTRGEAWAIWLRLSDQIKQVEADENAGSIDPENLVRKAVYVMRDALTLPDVPTAPALPLPSNRGPGVLGEEDGGTVTP